MKCKKNYKNQEKLRAYINRTKKKYRERTGSGQYQRREWTDEENEMVMNHSMTDRELGKLLERSVTAIQIQRVRIKAKMEEDNEEKHN